MAQYLRYTIKSDAMDESGNRNDRAPYHEQVAAGRAGGIVAEYIVEEKDTLPDIARKYGVSIQEIMLQTGKS